MEETIWISEEKGLASNPKNWSNGVPHYRKKAVFKDEATIVWDLKSISIPIEIRCDPDLIHIEGLAEYCMVDGSYFAPDEIIALYKTQIDEQTLDRPPPLEQTLVTFFKAGKLLPTEMVFTDDIAKGDAIVDFIRENDIKYGQIIEHGSVFKNWGNWI